MLEVSKVKLNGLVNMKVLEDNNMVTAHTNVIKNFHQLSETDKEKKLWKDRAHEFFDLIWEHRGYVERNTLYKYLGDYLNRNPHISTMKPGPCKKVIKWSIDILNESTRIEKKFGIDIYNIIEYPEYLELT